MGNIVFRNVKIGTGHGVTIGSEMSAGIYNVTFDNISIGRSDFGPRIKTRRGRGGVIDGITFRNIFASRADTMIEVNMNYWKHADPTNATATPSVRNLFFEDI